MVTGILSIELVLVVLIGQFKRIRMTPGLGEGKEASAKGLVFNS